MEKCLITICLSLEAKASIHTMCMVEKDCTLKRKESSERYTCICPVIAGKGGMLEILDSSYRPIMTKQFVSFFHDSANSKEMVAQNISEIQINAKTQGWMIDEVGNKFVLMKSGVIVPVEELINNFK